MPVSEQFLTEFDSEMAATRRMLERVPADKLGWKPHGKSRSLGELATHVAEIPRFGLRIQKDEFVVGSEQAPPMKSAADFLARFDSNVRESRQAIEGMSDTDLERDFAVTRGGKPMFTLKKRAVLRRTLLNHMIHHRGQLSVYLRIQDLPLPATYGPSADETI
jgi:uncharacterized damage-inducible protein DinB